MIRLLLSAFSSVATCAAVALAQSPTAPSAPARGGAAGTWILQVEGDIAGLKITGMVHKPFAWREPPASESDHRVRLLGPGGESLVSVPLDLSHFCVDADHRGEPPHVRGDEVIGHDIVCRVKVPALVDAVEVRVERDGEAGGAATAMTRVGVEALRPLGRRNTAPAVKTILRNGPESNRYDIVILGDGYQQHEESVFESDAQAVVANLFARAVFGNYRSFFNVHTVFRASVDSGADRPTATPPVLRNTVYDATYNYGGTQRCLYIQNTAQASADAMLAPDVESSVMVLVNDRRYGGCGGSFAVSYNGAQGPEVQAHEFGHSFGQLADEYDTGESGPYVGGEPASPNITADVTGMTKWPLWLGSAGVALFEGAGYHLKGLWRPKRTCLMRDLGSPLCPVCNEQLVVRCHTEVNALERQSPAAPTVAMQKPVTPTFAVSSLAVAGGPVDWLVDGQLVASGAPTFTWDPGALPSGRHLIVAQQTDQSEFVRKDPFGVLRNVTSWSVDLLSTDPGTFTLFGEGCAGSRVDPCLAQNESGNHFGGGLLPGAIHALAVTAPTEMAVGGFELHTSSRQPGSQLVDVALFSADASGRPHQLVRAGTMQVDAPLGWYGVTFPQPYPVSAGQRFFLAFRNPPQTITASSATGVRSDYFFAIRGDAWTGPLQAYLTYRVRCAAERPVVPTLSGSGFPEIGSSFDLQLSGANAMAQAVLLLAGSRTSWGDLELPYRLESVGAPGCALLVAGETVLPVAVDAQGAASLTIDIPALPDLFGRELHGQFLVRDAAANALGYAMTNGGTARIGR